MQAPDRWPIKTALNPAGLYEVDDIRLVPLIMNVGRNHFFASMLSNRIDEATLFPKTLCPEIAFSAWGLAQLFASRQAFDRLHHLCLTGQDN